MRPANEGGEDAVAAVLGPSPWVIIRPGVIYGPWDIEGLALLRMARGRITPGTTDPEPRIAMIHARDVAAAVAALSIGGPNHAAFEVSDGQARRLRLVRTYPDRRDGHRAQTPDGARARSIAARGGGRD